jgi:ankyrin repeat protein
MVRQLVAAGAQLDARNELGNTPLIAAAAARQPATVRALLALGADQRIRNGAAMSARDVAIRTGDVAVAALFDKK